MNNVISQVTVNFTVNKFSEEVNFISSIIACAKENHPLPLRIHQSVMFGYDFDTISKKLLPLVSPTKRHNLALLVSEILCGRPWILFMGRLDFRNEIESHTARSFRYFAGRSRGI